MDMDIGFRSRNGKCSFQFPRLDSQSILISHAEFSWIPSHFQGHPVAIPLFFPRVAPKKLGRNPPETKAAAWTLYCFCAALLRLATAGRSGAAKSLAQLLDVAAWGGGNKGGWGN